MCAVIGAVLKNPSLKDFQNLKNVFLESKIRGLHATGISFLPNWSSGKIVTIKEAIPADKFIETHMHNDNFKNFLNEDGNLYLIGHCRYSTSDLEYNQPIANDVMSVVHNGVITQELPENWEQLYGYKCTTKNDTELLLHTVEAGKSPLKEWADESLAVCELHKDKKVRVYRNGKRPLYLTSMTNGCIITSTADIANRANVGGTPVEVLMNHYITMDRHLAMIIERVDVADAVDYQHAIR